VGEERVALSPDRQSLVTRSPIAGAGLARVLANNEYDVPSNRGVVTSAVLTSGLADPFTIIPGEQTLIIRSTVHEATVTLPNGVIRVDALIPLINAAAVIPNSRPAWVASKNNLGALVIRENLRLGSESQLKVLGNANMALGLDQQFGATGRSVTPPWSLVRRTAVGALPDMNMGYEIRFNAPVSPNYFWSVTYTTPWNLCPRCKGTEVENDYRFDAQGAVLTVSDDNLLYQAVLKIVLTEARSNIYFPWYGSNVSASIGSKATAGVAATIRESVQQALRNLQSLQTNQAQYQTVTPKERLYSVDNLTVTPATDDPTVFLIDLQVRSYSFDPVNITIVYTVPGAYALPGTNRLSLGNYGQ
jgi:hypothetical protein